MPHPSPADAECLLDFNIQVLDQALALIALHQAPSAPSYAGPVGAHLRHVIEHYWALVRPACPGIVDYDARPRDRELEQSAELARTQVLAIQHDLSQWGAVALDTAIRVQTRIGLAGEVSFATTSSIGRELVFVASHAAHHFAVLHQHCEAHGLTVDADFGKAPATVAHERATRLHVVSRFTKELPCTSQLASL